MDELILRRAQKGDASAFEQLVTPYEQMIWRVCWHYLHHREDAMDCAQEVMLKAWRSIGQYRQDCGFSSWLYRIAGSVCIDFLRKQKRMVDSDSMDAMAENGFEPADDSPTPEAALLDRESTGDITHALDQLPADMRTVLILYALEKQRYEEIAQITGVSVGTVKSRLNRARRKLAAILANQRNKTKNQASYRVKGGQENEPRTPF